MPAEMSQTLEKTELDKFKSIIVQIVGANGVRDDAESLSLHSEDIWTRSKHRINLIIAPKSVEQIQQVVQAANAAGVAIAPRGAGMSYTSSYIPYVERTISLDMSKMDRVVEVRPQDMTVTVEPGCTWATLNEALKPHGVRTPFWGPMSGLKSTIGGGISQLNAMLGAGHYGTSSESVISLTMVLADGSILRTGAKGTGSAPFYRHYGPDLTGIFCGDSGAMGVKAQITLRLIPAPSHEDYVAFSFPSGEAMLEAMAGMSRADVASEMCAFDPGLTKVRMKRASLTSDVKTLGAVIGKQKNLGKGLLAAAKIALGGRSFIPEGDYNLHLIAEGRSAAAVAADIATAKKIAADHGGKEIENTIAKVIRAVPFPPLNSVLGPQGEGWVPVHGMVQLSDAAACFADIQALFAKLAPEFEKAGVYNGYLFTTVSTNAVTIEPVFYWPDERRPIHEKTIEGHFLAKLPKLAPNAQSHATVVEARKQVVEIFERYGAGHFQIGRSYPYRDSLDDASKALLDAIKKAVDPAGRFNPGALGFSIGASKL